MNQMSLPQTILEMLSIDNVGKQPHGFKRI